MKSSTEDGEFEFITIPPREAHLLNDCFLKYMTEEEVYATVGFDMENDGDELLKMFHQGMFRKDSPQLALWDCEKQRVGGMLLSSIIDRKRESKGSRDISKLNLPPLTKERCNDVDKFFGDIGEKYLDPDYYGTDKLAILNALYIGKDYRRKGFSSKIFEAAIAACQEKSDIEVFVSFISSPHTLRAAKKMGFTELFVKEFRGHLAAYERMTEDTKLTHDRVTVVVKRFE